MPPILLAPLTTLFFLFCWSTAADAARSQKIEVPNDDVPERLFQGYSFAPILGYDPTFGALLGGAAFRGEMLATPYTDASLLLYGTAKKNFALEFKYKFWDRERTFYYLEVLPNNFFDPYYGEGDQTVDASRRDIDTFKLYVNPSYGYRLDRWLTLGVYSQLRYREETGVGGDPTQRVFGTEFRPILGVSAIYDTRDNQRDSHRGVYAGLNLDGSLAATSTKVGASDFVRLEADFRKFYSPWEMLVLAAQIRAGVSAGDLGYLYRFTLGGGDTIRGFGPNRFRGFAYYFGQVEARFQLLPWFGVVGFAALGDTGDRTFSDFRKPQFGKGLGLRFGLPPDYVAKARLDFGFADDKMAIYLSFNEVF